MGEIKGCDAVGHGCAGEKGRGAEECWPLLPKLQTLATQARTLTPRPQAVVVASCKPPFPDVEDAAGNRAQRILVYGSAWGMDQDEKGVRKSAEQAKIRRVGQAGITRRSIMHGGG